MLDPRSFPQVRSRILNQCSRLQVQALPLVQFFWADYGVKRYVDVARMLGELREEGVIRELGVTNFDLPRLRELVDAGIPVVSNQVGPPARVRRVRGRLHHPRPFISKPPPLPTRAMPQVQLSALDQRPIQSGMAAYCASKNIKLLAFGTVGAGILSERYLGQPAPGESQIREGGYSLSMYSATASRFGPWELVQELLAEMAAIAAKHPGATIANVAQRFVLQQVEGAVGGLIVGVRNSNHIKENVHTFSFKLSAAEMSALQAIVDRRKGPRGDVWDIERGYMS